MSDELTIAGKTYVSSKRAAVTTGYAQDYIGQLARSGQIDAQRVGGLWYVFLESLEAYKTRTDDFKPQPPVAAPTHDPESVVSFDGKDYISANRAAKVTGYNQDYIGQLARSGKVLSRQIGNRWYVDRAGLIAHKAEKDSLLAAVQRDAVGLRSPAVVSDTREPVISPYQSAPIPVQATVTAAQPEEDSNAPVLTYITETKDLMPFIAEKTEENDQAPQRIPITVKAPRLTPYTKAPVPQKRSKFNAEKVVKAVSVLTIVVVLSYSFVSLSQNARFASAIQGITGNLKDRAGVASAANSVDGIIAALENFLTKELVYTRSN